VDRFAAEAQRAFIKSFGACAPASAVPAFDLFGRGSDGNSEPVAEILTSDMKAVFNKVTEISEKLPSLKSLRDGAVPAKAMRTTGKGP